MLFAKSESEDKFIKQIRATVLNELELNKGDASHSNFQIISKV